MACPLLTKEIKEIIDAYNEAYPNDRISYNIGLTDIGIIVQRKGNLEYVPSVEELYEFRTEQKEKERQSKIDIEREQRLPFENDNRSVENTVPKSTYGENDNPENLNTLKETKEILDSPKTILSNEELKYWNEKGVGNNPRILVASEKTDPAFHVDEIIDVLEGKKSINRWWERKRLSGKDFAGLYLITKHDGIPMKRLLETKIPKLIHFSITGLGGTAWEPGVMKYNDLLDRIEEYLKIGLDPESVTIRIDPIVPGVTKAEDIEAIVKRASEMGIKRIRFSIMDLYPSIVQLMKDNKYDIDKYYGTQSPDADVKYQHGYNKNAKPEYINEIVDLMLRLKDKYDITLGTCAENFEREGISKEGCLSVALINKMLGTSFEDKGPENNQQRKECSCFGGKVDCLDYKDSICMSHCVYCYAHHQNEAAMNYYDKDGKLKDNNYTRVLEEVRQEEPETQGLQAQQSQQPEAQSQIPTESINSEDSQERMKILRQRDAANREFTPEIKRMRSSLIARLFSNTITRYIRTGEFKGLSRDEALRKATPQRIFNEIKQSFITTVAAYNSKDEATKKALLNSIAKRLYGDTAVYETLTDTQKEETDKFTKHLATEYDKIIKHFDQLCREASPIISFLEDCKLSQKYNTILDKEEDDFNEDGESTSENQNEDNSQETAAKDGWMLDKRERSSFSGLTSLVKRAISSIHMTTPDGRPVKDDLGNLVYIDPDKGHEMVRAALSRMVYPEDLIPMLEEAAKSKPYLNKIINFLKRDESAFSQFFQCYDLNTLNYRAIIPVRDKSGNVTEGTKDLSGRSKIQKIIDQWNSNYDSRIPQDTKSVYNEKGEKIDTNVQAGLTTISKLINKFADNTAEVTNEDVKTVAQLLRMTGMDIVDQDIIDAIDNSRSKLSSMIQSLQTIYNYLDRNWSGEAKGSILTNLKGATQNIATMLQDYVGPYSEDSITETFEGKTKTYYPHTPLSFLGKLLKKIKYLDSARREAFLEEEYGKSNFFKKDGKWLNEILELIEKDPSFRQAIDHHIILHKDKVAPSSWTELDQLVTYIQEYFSKTSESGYGWYYIPVMSNSNSIESVKLKKYTGDNYIDEICERLKDVVVQEYQRIQSVRRRDQQKENGEAITELPSDRRGEQFLFLPRLNDLMVTNSRGEQVTFLEGLEELIENGATDTELDNYIIDNVKNIMEKSFDYFLKKAKKEGIFNVEEGASKYSYIPDVTIEKDDVAAVEALRNYFYNNVYAVTELTQLLGGDLAMYPSSDAFQKRFLQVHGMTQRLNTAATWKGERVGKETQSVLYLSDEILKEAGSLTEVEAIMDAAVESGRISKSLAENIKKKFTNITTTDGQAFRTLPSYRAMRIMEGKWSDELENSYNRIVSGKATIEDIGIMFQPDKPFTYSYEMVTSESGRVEKVPIQFKDAEFPLLAAYTIAGVLGENSKLKALNQFMIDKDIDVVQFSSSIKVGENNTVENTAEDIDSFTEALNKAYNEGQGIHLIRVEDYGIQTQNPEHFVDQRQLRGNQFMRLIFPDVPEGTQIKVGKTTKSKEHWWKLYNDLLISNLKEDYKAVRDLFSNPRLLATKLESLLEGSDRYGEEMKLNCTLDPRTNKFLFPLFNPVNSRQIQALVLSFIKNTITKQKTRGGSLVQVSSGMLSDDLRIVFKDKNGKDLTYDIFKNRPENRDKNDEVLKKEYYSMVKEAIANQELSIAYYECYMPVYSKDLIDAYMDKETQTINADDIPEELRKAIGYRIPTEAVHFMAPLRIKGFLPMQNSGSIMFPSELTVINDSDFDLDKLYIILPEFYVQKYDIRRAKEDYLKLKDIDSLSSALVAALNDPESKLPEEGKEAMKGEFKEFNDWFNENKENYLLDKPVIVPVRYDYSKSPDEQKRANRDRGLFDIAWGMLTSPYNTSRMLRPGGSDLVKKAGRMATLLRSYSLKELTKKYNKIAKRKGLEKATERTIKDIILKADQNTLKDLLDSSLEDSSPAFPTTQMYYFGQNAVGSAMIPRAATQNTNHGLAQETDLSIKDKYTFMLDGRVEKKLNAIFNANGDYISKSISEVLAAAVDNAKEQSLALLNFNAFTSNSVMALLRLGYDMDTIALLMNQPVIIEMSNRFMRDSKSGKRADVVIKETIRDYIRKAGGIKESTYKFTKAELSDFLIDHKKAEDGDTSTLDSVQQLAVAHLFEKIWEVGDDLGELVRSTRSDSQNGAAGGSIAATEERIQSIRTFLGKAKSKIFTIEGANEFINSDNVDENIKSNYEGSSIPFLQAFQDLGLESVGEFLAPYFMQYSKGTQNVLAEITSLTKYDKLGEKLRNKAYEHLTAYVLSDLDFFGKDDKHDSIRAKRAYYINKFPTDFMNTIKNDEELSSLELIKSLSVRKGVLVLNTPMRMTKNMREAYARDWASLLYMGDKGVQLAHDLVAYSFFRNGLSFGSNSFGHLCPLIVLESIPGYTDKLYSMLNSDNYDDFVDQFVRNNLNNRSLVPEVPKKASFRFTDDEGNLLDEVDLHVDKDSSIEDKTIVKRFGKDDVIFMNYIMVNTDSGPVYYRFMEYGEDGIYSGVYQRVEPLGRYNSYIEYEYGVENPQSIISSDSNIGEQNTKSEEDLDSDELSTGKSESFGTTEDQQNKGSNQTFPTREGAADFDKFSAADTEKCPDKDMCVKR